MDRERDEHTPGEAVDKGGDRGETWTEGTKGNGTKTKTRRVEAAASVRRQRKTRGNQRRVAIVAETLVGGESVQVKSRETGQFPWHPAARTLSLAVGTGSSPIYEFSPSAG